MSGRFIGYEPSRIVRVGGTFLDVAEFAACSSPDPAAAAALAEQGVHVRSVIYLKSGQAISSAARPETVVRKVDTWTQLYAEWLDNQMRIQSGTAYSSHAIGSPPYAAIPVIGNGS